AIGEAREHLVGGPWHPPRHVLRTAAILTAARVFGPPDASSEALRQVLDVRREEERAGVEHQKAQVGVASVAVQLLGAVAAEHAGSDDHGVERKAAILLLGL